MLDWERHKSGIDMDIFAEADGIELDQVKIRLNEGARMQTRRGPPPAPIHPPPAAPIPQQGGQQLRPRLPPPPIPPYPVVQFPIQPQQPTIVTPRGTAPQNTRQAPRPQARGILQTQMTPI